MGDPGETGHRGGGQDLLAAGPARQIRCRHQEAGTGWPFNLLFLPILIRLKEKLVEGKEDPDIWVRRQHESTALGRGGVLEKYTRSN